MITFLHNIYEDLLMYSSQPIFSLYERDLVSQNFIRIQGIKTYFNNYLLSNSSASVGFDTIDSVFHGFVSASIERKFASVGPTPSQQYVDAKAFVYDFFTTYFYDPISQNLASAYEDKYFGYFKNALNLGNNRLLPIINFDMLDEKSEPTDPLTLLVKLKDELPSDLSIQAQCWISNIALTPFVVSAIIQASGQIDVHRIGPPDFSIKPLNTAITNTNLCTRLPI